MKLGIVTFQRYNNYGAVLQNYSLCSVLEKLGHEVEVVDYDCQYISRPYRFINLKKKGLFNYIYGVIGYICYLPRKRKFEQFRKRMNYSPQMSREDILSNDFDYDGYIAGSDQIWNHKLTNGDNTYFLDFVKDKKKYSYAASMGEINIHPKIQDEYKELLKSFDRILVREQDNMEEVKTHLGLECDVVLDPTLLLKQSEWDEVCKESVAPKGDYILVYQLGISPKVVKYARQLKKKTGLKVQYVPFPLGSCMVAKLNIGVGPIEWVNLFKNAKYVVTDSFHGIAFSVIFNKQFWVEVTGHHKNKRAENFLKLLGLEDRSIESAMATDSHTDIDYEKVNAMLAQQCERSMTLLYDMLENH